MGSLGYYAGILKDFGLPRTLKLAKNIFYVPGNKDNKFSIGYISLSNICPNNCRDCYVKKGNNILDIEIADKYIKILHDQGVRTFVFVGGEPLLYNSKNNMFNLIGKHPKDTFHICTSTTGLTKYDSIKASQYKNIVFVLSIDGLEENNDIRRGDKSFEKTINAARILRNNKNPLGVYTTINSLNYKEISSEKYIDFLISEGFKFISFHRHFSIKDAYSLCIDDDKYVLALRRLHALAKRKPIILYSGYLGDLKNPNLKNRHTTLFLSPTGELKAGRTGESCGNMNKTTLIKIIKSEKLQNIIDKDRDFSNRRDGNMEEILKQILESQT